jgi:WD40 repeat protein
VYKNNYHTTLANYFASKPLFFDGDKQKQPYIRKCMEQPWQQTKAAIWSNKKSLWDDVTNTLCNLNFIEAKAYAKQMDDLIEDFKAVLKVLPENQENIERETKRQERLDNYTKELIDCAEGKISIELIDIPKSITPLSTNQIKKISEKYFFQIQNNQKNCIERLKPFSDFVNSKYHNLRYHGNSPGFCMQEAYNYGLFPFDDNVLYKKSYELLLLNVAPPNYNPFPEILKTIETQIHAAQHVEISPDSKFVYSMTDRKYITKYDITTNKRMFAVPHIGENDGTIYNSYENYYNTPNDIFFRKIENSTIEIYDKKNKNIISNLKGHKNHFFKCWHGTSDGNRAVTVDSNNTIKFWDVKKARCFKRIKCESSSIDKIYILPNGQKAYTLQYVNRSKSNNGFRNYPSKVQMSVFEWDIKKKERFNSKKKGLFEADNFYIPASGRYALLKISKGIQLWDLYKKNQLQEIEIKDYFECFTLTPDAKLALIGYSDYISIYDMNNRSLVRKLNSPIGGICSISICSDGKIAASGHHDGRILIWDIESGITTNWKNYELELNTIICDKSSKPFKYIFWQGLNSHDIHIADLVNKRIRTIKNTNPVKLYYCSISNQIITYSYKEKALKVFDFEKKHQIQNYSNIDYPYFTFTPDKRRLISYDTGELREKIILWQTNTGERIKKILLNSSIFDSLQISIDGRFLYFQNTKGIFSILNLCNYTLFESKLQFESKKLKSSGKIDFRVLPDGYNLCGFDFAKIYIFNPIKGESEIIGKLVRRPKDFDISSDGRYAITNCGKQLKIWSLSNKKLLGGAQINQKKDNYEIKNTVLSNNGEVLYYSVDDTIYVLQIISSKKDLKVLGTLKLGEYVAKIFLEEKFGILYCWLARGRIKKFKIQNLKKTAACLTARKLWLYNFKTSTSTWDTNYTADCPWCRKVFIVDEQIINKINTNYCEVQQKFHLNSYLDLPNKSWEDPGLLSECPYCREKLKFNPFIAGGKDY